MKLKKRRFVAILLSMCLLIGILPANVFAEDETTGTFEAIGGNVMYRVMEDDTILITGCDETVTEVVIPDTIEGKVVTAIDSDAFNSCENLAALDLGECVQSIGFRAFAKTAITTLHLPNSVTEIDEGAFEYCTSLTSVDWPDNVNFTTINGFCGCTSLPAEEVNEALALPSVTTVGHSAFSECAFESVVIPENIKMIERYAFSYNSILKNVDFSSSTQLTEIGDRAFESSYSILEVDLSSCVSLTSIGEYAFSNTGIEKVTFPSSLSKLGSYAFSKSNLKSVDLSETSLSVVEDYAFSWTDLTSVKLADGITEIGTGAFCECKELTSVDFGSGVQKIAAFAFYKNALTEISLPNSLTTIEKDAFSDCTSLASIEWPSNDAFTTVNGFDGCTSLSAEEVNKALALPGVTTVGEGSFSRCAFDSLIIPANIRKIEDLAFNNLEGLSSLTILPGTESIGKFAFAHNDGLADKTVEIPETVREIREGAFDGCSWSESSGNMPITIEIKNPDFSLTETTDGYAEVVNIDGKNYENPFNSGSGTVVVIRAYENDSNGNPSMLKRFYEAVKDEMVLEQNQYTFVPLDKEVFYTVSGKVPSGATVKLYQDDAEIPVTLTENRFEVAAASGSKVSVEVAMEGYYNKYFIQTPIKSNWDLGNITFMDADKIPMNKTMQVDFGDAVLNGFQNLGISLEADGRKLTEGTDFHLQYPYIILSDTVTEEKLTLTINADKVCYTGGSVTANRSERLFSLPLTPWGKLDITADSEFAGDNHVLVFGSDDALVESSIIPKDGFCRINSLKAGDYTVIAYNANDSFSSVATEADLKTLGLSEEKDYAKVTVDVSDNQTSEMKITVPQLKTSVDGILEREKCAVVCETQVACTELDYTVRVNYAFAGSKSGILSVLLPEDARVKYVCSATSRLKEGTDYSISGNTLSVKKTEKEGMIYLIMVCKKNGMHSISAAASLKGMTAPIGSTTFQMQKMTIQPYSQRLTSLRGNSVKVTASSGSEVTLLLDGEIVATGTTNKRGNITFDYELPKTASFGQVFKLTAKVGMDSVSEDVTYSVSKEKVGLETWNFYQTNRSNSVYNGRCLYDAQNPTDPSSHYWYVLNEEGDNYWTISATFVGEIEPENVVTYVGMLDGSVKDVSMKLFKTEDIGETEHRYTFAGEMYLPSDKSGVVTEAQIPTKFAIDWEGNEEAFTYDAETEDQIRKKTDERQKNRQETIEAINESVEDPLKGLVPELDNPSEYIFGAQYRVSETNKAWFEGLDIEAQTVIYNMEKAIDEACETFSEDLGLEKNINEYNSIEEVCAELGVTISENTQTAEELRGEGFEVYEESDGSFVAIKDNAIQTQSEEAEKEETGYAATLYGRALGRGRGENAGGVTYVDSKGNRVDFAEEARDNTWQAAYSNGFAALGFTYEAFVGYITKHPDVLAGNPIAILNGVNHVFTAFGAVIGSHNAIQDSEAVETWNVRRDEMQGYIDELKLYETRYQDKHLCSNAIMRERHTAETLRILFNAESSRFIGSSSVGALLTGFGVADKSHIIDGVSLTIDIASCSIGERRAAEIQALQDKLWLLQRDRMKKCGDTDMEKIMKNAYHRNLLKPIMDPSGVVYEAVESNPLSDVTATVWYADDQNGTNAQIWNAADYEQINPQNTDADGMYGWDVPVGWWQVRFEKKGYETASTEWMRVPPPRMNLKTAMVSTEAPEVLFANAYSDYIEVIFSQYMDISKDIILPDGMTGTWQSAENGYSKVLHITRPGGFVLGGSVSFTLEGAQNYAGKALAPYSSGDLTVFARPAEIILNYDSVIPVIVGSDLQTTVRIKDSEGNYMEGVTVEAELSDNVIAKLSTESAVTDAEGKVVFNAETLLPGFSNITFRVQGTSLTKTVVLRAAMEENRPLRPTASIGITEFTKDSPKENYITIQGGEKLTISAEDDVTIYYTTDDSCPCQNSANRQIYTEPVTITENTKFRIAAYKDGMEYSERLNITVTVDEKHSHRYGTEWKSDENTHWHECECGAISDQADHDWLVENAKDATDTETGYTGDKSCKICGYQVKGEEIPAKGLDNPTEPVYPDESDLKKTENSENNGSMKSEVDNSKQIKSAVSGKNDSKDAKTGDNGDIMIWLIVLILSSSVIFGRIMYLKKKKI